MIFCIIPALNEGGKISRIVKDAKKYVDKVVVVDDGSDDNTAVEAGRAGAKVIKHLINRGQGAALETGDAYALRNGAEIIVHFDADGQFRAEDIANMLAPIENEGFDICLGSRFLGVKSQMPWLKKSIIFPAARLVNRMMGVSLSDPQNGFRAFTRKVAVNIHLDQDRSAHCSEFLGKAFSGGFSVKEVPVHVKYSEFGQGIFGGRSAGTGGLLILKDLLMAKFLD